MRYADDKFRHESLHDAESIRGLLEALAEGIAKGQLTFSDDSGEISMQPHGLINLRLSASQGDRLNRVSIRISWQKKDRKKKQKKLTEKTGKKP